MDVLLISNTIPHNEGGGGATRVINLLRQLARWCEVDFLPIPFTGYNSEQIAEFSQICPGVRLIEMAEARSAPWQVISSRSLSRRIINRLCHLLPNDPPYRAKWLPGYLEGIKTILAQTLSCKHYDLIQFEHSELGSWKALVTGSYLFALDFQDVVSAQIWNCLPLNKSWHKKGEQLIEWAKFLKFERKWSLNFDLCLVMSEQERQRLKKIQPNCNVAVVPNGVDISYFYPANQTYIPERLVFTGSMSHSPNADAMLLFCKEILPLVQARFPQATLDIVGHHPSPQVRALQAQYKGVRVIGAVEDVRPYIWDAAVYVAPIHTGGGTRLKVLEALACGKALVTTSFAGEGIEICNEVNALVRDDSPAFAEAIIELFSNPLKNQTLGQAGRELMIEKYDWEKIGAMLFQYYSQLSTKYSSLTGFRV